MSSPLHIDTHEGTFDRGVEHVGNPQARLLVELDVPHLLKGLAHRVAGDVAVAGQFMAGTSPCRRAALDIVLGRAAGSRPTPARPILPVAMARLAMAITVVEP